MTEQAATTSAGPRGEGVNPGELGNHVMEYRVSRIVAWVSWPLVAFSSALLTLGLLSYFTSSEFNSDSLLLFGILMFLAIASLATGLSAMRTRFSVCENGVACSGLFREQTFHFTQIAKMSVSRSPLANLRRPFNALKPHLVIETMGPQSATYRICPFLISDFTIFDVAVDKWKAVSGDAEPVSTDA